MGFKTCTDKAKNTMILDIVVVVVLFISAIIAFLRGLIREVLTIAGVAGGLAAAYFLGPILIPIMRSSLGIGDVTGAEEMEKFFGILPQDVVADALSYGLIFIIVVILLSVISHFAAESVKKIGLGAIDRTFGFIFGLLRGILILGLLYMPAYLFIDGATKDTYIGTSKTRAYLEKTSEALASFIPSETTDNLNKNIGDIGEKIGAREKLEQIDLLKESQQQLEQLKQSPDAVNAGGYESQARQMMDQLIKEQTQQKTNE